MSQPPTSPIIPTLPSNDTSATILASSYNNRERNKNTPYQFLIDECLWAFNYPELQKACFLGRICSVKPPQQCQFLNIKSILQSGPTCGLTAISMMLDGALTSNELLRDAQKKQYSNNGEMFSARYLFQLIMDHISIIEGNKITTTTDVNNKHYTDNIKCNQNKVECQLYEGCLNSIKVKECLKQGACLFVPYPFHKENTHCKLC